jgi:hypothetical protein
MPIPVMERIYTQIALFKMYLLPMPGMIEEMGQCLAIITGMSRNNTKEALENIVFLICPEYSKYAVLYHVVVISSQRYTSYSREILKH